MTDKIADAKYAFAAQQGRPFPGSDAKVAELTQRYGRPDTREVVRMMVVWAAANGSGPVPQPT